jgi:hypothetical protein
MKASTFKSICESAKRVMLDEAEAPRNSQMKLYILTIQRGNELVTKEVAGYSINHVLERAKRYDIFRAGDKLVNFVTK